MKHCAYNKRVFTSLCVVGVRNVEQRPDLRSWKVTMRNQKCTLKNPWSVRRRGGDNCSSVRQCWDVGEANQSEV